MRFDLNWRYQCIAHMMMCWKGASSLSSDLVGHLASLLRSLPCFFKEVGDLDLDFLDIFLRPLYFLARNYIAKNVVLSINTEEIKVEVCSCAWRSFPAPG